VAGRRPASREDEQVSLPDYPESRYSGDGEVSAVVRRSGQAHDLEMGPGGTQVHYLATGAQTHGEFGLYRWDFTGPRSGPDPHFHRRVSESFFVLSGTVQLYDGRSWADAGPGDYMFVPEGGIHGFRNVSGEPASMLLLFAPGAAREPYFEGLASWARTGVRPGDEERAEFMLRHDNHWI
jgi:mannose-6-phosphate isomerase-like protein (cupin superfamily)